MTDQLPTGARCEPPTQTVRSAPGNRWLASLNAWDSGFDRDAMGVLFAAAPAMLAALRQAVDWVEFTGIADEDPPEYVAMLAAIVAATGDAQAQSKLWAATDRCTACGCDLGDPSSTAAEDGMCGECIEGET